MQHYTSNCPKVAMLIQPVDYFLLVWFLLAAASTLYVAVDQFRNNPEPTVMKWGFILVTLYMGPFGLLLYVMADKSRGRESTRSSWRRCGVKAWTRRFTASRATQPGSSWPRWSLRRWVSRCGSTSSSNTWLDSPSGFSSSGHSARAGQPTRAWPTGRRGRVHPRSRGAAIPSPSLSTFGPFPDRAGR